MKDDLLEGVADEEQERMWLVVDQGWLTDGLDLRRKGLFLIWVVPGRYRFIKTCSTQLLNWIKDKVGSYIKWIGRDFKSVVPIWKYNLDCYWTKLRSVLLHTVEPMTNLDSILKSRDITLLTKVRLVKSMVFPVVMYGCESWTVKKAERQRIDAFELWC